MTEIEGSTLAHPPVLYFLVGDRTSGIVGYTWRIGTSGTSFYLKLRYTPLSSVKISLHGPDPRPGLGPPGFKIAIDLQAQRKAAAAGGVVAGLDSMRPAWFTGRATENGAVHAITFRSTWDLFQPGVPSAPNPGEIKPKTRGLIVPPPPILAAADVEIYVSSGHPYWRNEQQAREDNACLGPIRNQADQYLTGVSARRSSLMKPTPKVSPSACTILKRRSCSRRGHGHR
jgi:hypothetical protein